MVLLLVLCLTLALSACGNESTDEFSPLQSFQYHFYPEEYEEEYSEFQTTFTLEADTDYQFQLNAVCISGTIEIKVSYKNVEDKMYIVNSSAPCSDTISIPANTTETVSFAIIIEPDTEGDVNGEILTSQ